MTDKQAENNNYDIIIIGSGMGALTSASLLAQFRNKRILILERHYIFGGFTHEFERKQKWSWDVGIHYVGDMHDEGSLRKLFDIITREKVKWNPMPDVFEKFVYPDFTFGVPSEESRYIAKLIEQFPEEKAGIEGYFEDCKKVDQWFSRHNIKSPRPFINEIKKSVQLNGFDSPDITLGEYLNKNIKDKKLRALLASQWGDYGITPAHSSFISHVGIVNHYLNGGYFPEGGSKTIAESIKPIIEEKGGEVKLSHQVEEILVEDGKAVGVRARNLVARKDQPEVAEFYAPTIISNTGAYTTYLKLLPAAVEIPFRNKLKDFYKKHHVTTSVTLYCGLNDDPRKLGFEGENHWMFSSYNHERAFDPENNWIEGDGELNGAYLSFPSLKNSKAKGHSAEIIALCSFDAFEKWDDTRWKRRGDDYEELKTKIANTLTNFVDKLYPGFKDLLEYQELSTPLSVKHFTDHPRGSIYGMPSVRERFNSDEAPWCTPLTPVEGLYLTGADVVNLGVAGALMGGISTAGQVPDGISFIGVMKEAKKIHLQKQKEIASV